MNTLVHQLDDAKGRCQEALGYLYGSASDPALHRIIYGLALLLGEIRRDVAGDPRPYDARELSCQGLTLVSLDPDPKYPTFHGHPVTGYAEELARRGEAHVYGCDLIGHLATEHTN